jgi:hypothetical protein
MRRNEVWRETLLTYTKTDRMFLVLLAKAVQT